MRTTNKLVFSGFTVFALSSLTVPVAAQQAGDPVPDTFICTFVPGPLSVTYEANRAAQQAGGQLIHTYSSAINGFAIQLPKPALDRMVENNLAISDCVQSLYVRLPDGESDTAARGAQGKPDGGGGGKPGGGGGSSGGQTVPWGVALVGSETSTKTAWVVDTGVDLDHPDLNVDVSRSESFLSTTSRRAYASSPDDYNGHGTHVAGTIAAINNTVDVIGVASGATVVSVRVLDHRGVAPDADVAAGLQYVLNNALAGDVVNLSLTADAGSTILNVFVQDIATKGVFVVMAAGNSAIDVDSNSVSPGNQNGLYLYTVSAVDQNKALAFFSNYGLSIDYAEPGVGILSLARGGGTTTKDGTSMAAPHLSGILLVTGGTVGDGAAISGDKDSKTDSVGIIS